MPLGIISDAEFEEELKDSGVKPEVLTPEVLPARVEQIKPGGRDNSPNTPDSLRKIIGEEYLTNGRASAQALAKTFGISSRAVGSYAVGGTSPNTQATHRPNKEFLNGVREKITKRASHRLNLALNHITDEKLASANVKDVAQVARSMSSIIKDMQPEIENADRPVPPQILVYAPTVRNEEKFEVIYAKDE